MALQMRTYRLPISASAGGNQSSKNLGHPATPAAADRQGVDASNYIADNQNSLIKRASPVHIPSRRLMPVTAL